MNLDYLKLRTMTAAMKLLPAATYDTILREQIARVTKEANIDVGPMLGLVEDVLPRDAHVRETWHQFKEALWDWYTRAGERTP